MISNSIIELLPPSLELVDEVQEALIESYDDLKTFLLWPKPNPSREDVYSNMQQAIRNFDKKIIEFRFQIRRLSDGKIVGATGLLIRDIDVPFFEFGYWVRSSERGKGYITMAVQLLENYAANELNAKRLEIRMAETNEASRRVAERAGFKYEALVHSDRRLPSGEIDNSHIYYKTYP